LEPGQNVTLAGWIYPIAYNPVGYNSGIIYKQGNQYGCCFQPAYGMALQTAGTLIFGVADAASYASLASTQAVPLNTWTHVAAVRNGSTMTLYINGVQAATGSNMLGNLVDTSSPLLLGQSSGGWGNDSFDGRLDELRIYNRALSASEVSALYNAGNADT
jgi:Concanavalin A-like lectin/glucanases superfamily